jgi:hypothetical protein
MVAELMIKPSSLISNGIEVEPFGNLLEKSKCHMLSADDPIDPPMKLT